MPPFPQSLHMHSLYLLLYLKAGSFLRPLLWTLFIQISSDQEEVLIFTWAPTVISQHFAYIFGQK